MALGALVGLALAGYGLFTAKGTTTRVVPPEDVALVNQRPVLMSDFVAQVEAVYGGQFAEATGQQRRKVLNDMIYEELLVQRGLELDFSGSDPDTRTALVAAVDQQVVADITTAQPAEDSLRSFYVQHRDRYESEGTLELHDWVPISATQHHAHLMDTASQAAAALRSGAPPDTVAARFGLRDSGRTQGEEFYFAAKLHLGDRSFTAAAALLDGEVSEPIAEADGPHILQMIHSHPPVPRSFERAHEQVLDDYKREAAARLRAADKNYLYSKAEILIATPYK